MVDDLQNKHRLIGMKREEILGILGEPDRKNRVSIDDYNYSIGQEQGFMPIDCEWLTLVFENAKVCQVKITTD